MATSTNHSCPLTIGDYVEVGRGWGGFRDRMGFDSGGITVPFGVVYYSRPEEGVYLEPVIVPPSLSVMQSMARAKRGQMKHMFTSSVVPRLLMRLTEIRQGARNVLYYE